jgi:hypothetical protein
MHKRREAVDEDKLKDIILNTIEVSLDAQLRAVRRLRSNQEVIARKPKQKGMSQVDLAFDILKKAQSPLHISEIIARIEQTHRRRVDRESLASALSKKVQRRDRFLRADKNVFGLLQQGK